MITITDNRPTYRKADHSLGGYHWECIGFKGYVRKTRWGWQASCRAKLWGREVHGSPYPTRDEGVHDAIRQLRYERRRQLIEEIEGLPGDPAKNSAAFELLIQSIRGLQIDMTDFRRLDEKPGLFPHYPEGSWYRRLRQVRNATDTPLFDALAANTYKETR